MSPATTRQQRRAAARASTKTGATGRWPWLAALGGSALVVALAVWWFAPGPGQTAALVRDGAPSWSPDGAHIAFYSERDGQPADLFVVNLDGTSERQLTRTPAAEEGYPAWSPDGRQIAYEADGPDGNFDVYVMNADGSNVRRLTTDSKRDVGPAWSPDGTKIAFMSDRAGQEFDVYQMKADGSDVERLTSGETNWFPQYSPDGRQLALHVGRDVHLFDLGTRALQSLTREPDNGMYPTWSPDGRRLAFMSWRRGKTEIFTMNADGSDQRVLVSLPLGSAIDPRWSPDGSKIVFVETPATEQAFNESVPQESVIYTVEVATGSVRKLRNNKP